MAMWPLHRIHAPKQHRNELCEYAICEITNPQSYYGDKNLSYKFLDLLKRNDFHTKYFLIKVVIIEA